MADDRIGPSIPPSIQTTNIEQPVEIPSEPETLPEVSTLQDPELAAGTEEAMNKAGTETKGYLDTGGEYLKERLGEELVSPLMDDLDPKAELQRILQEVDPNQEEPKAPGQMTQAILERGMMQSQFGAPIALPNAVKGLVNVKLTPKQEDAKKVLEGLPAWSKLTDAQKNQITVGLSKISDKNLDQQVDKIKARFEAIDTVSSRSAWNELTPAQQQKITDQLLKLSGDQLKNEVTKIGGKFDSIEKLTQSPAWSSFNADQKAKLTDPVLTLSGDRLKTTLAQTQEKLDSIASFTKQPSWKQLQPADQQKIVDHILKTPQDKLKLTTENVQATIDFVATLKSNSVDPGTTLDKLLALESTQVRGYPRDPQKSFQKMKAALAEGGNQINAAKDKKTVATDIKDIVNFSVDRGLEIGSYYAPPEIRGEIVQRFLKQYQNDPADFQKTRDLLNKMPDARLSIHGMTSNRIGVDIPGNANNVDLKNVKNVPAGQETKFKRAIGNLLQREGNLDTINFWDNQIISLGVRQWSTYGGDLVPLLKDFQKANPQKFAQLLPGVKIENNQVLYNGKALTPAVDKNGKPLPGQDARSLIENLKQSEIIDLSNMFNKLGKDPDFQTVQLQDNVNRINRMLGSSVGSHKIGDYIKSDRGIGQLVSYEAFSLGYVQKAFNKSVKDLAGELGLKSDAPSRQELLDALKTKVLGNPDPKNKIEPDKAFIEKLQQKYGKDIVDQLKTDGGREAFLEKRLIADYRDNFIAQLPQKEQPRFRARFESTERYYDKL